MKPVAAKLAQEIVADHFGTLPEVRLPRCRLSLLSGMLARHRATPPAACVPCRSPPPACPLARLLSGPSSLTAG